MRSHKEREILTRTDGGESVQIEIFKEGDANIVALAKRVKACSASSTITDDRDERRGGRGGRGNPKAGDDGRRERARRPAVIVARSVRRRGRAPQVVADRSLFIESSINEVRNTAIMRRPAGDPDPLPVPAQLQEHRRSSR